MNLSDILFIKKKISILNQNNSSSFSPSKSNDFLFIIPGPSAPGSGGHNTLSMFINFLSKNIENSIYIFYYRCCFKTVEEQHEMFVNGYSLKKEIKAININDLSSFHFKAVFYTDHLSWFLTDVISSKKNLYFFKTGNNYLKRQVGNQYSQNIIYKILMFIFVLQHGSNK